MTSQWWRHVVLHFYVFPVIFVQVSPGLLEHHAEEDCERCDSQRRLRLKPFGGFWQVVVVCLILRDHVKKKVVGNLACPGFSKALFCSRCQMLSSRCQMLWSNQTETSLRPKEDLRTTDGLATDLMLSQRWNYRSTASCSEKPSIPVLEISLYKTSFISNPLPSPPPSPWREYQSRLVVDQTRQSSTT